MVLSYGMAVWSCRISNNGMQTDFAVPLYVRAYSYISYVVIFFHIFLIPLLDKTTSKKAEGYSTW
jgi:hypothetical protein